jgi:hypothetical protein
MYTWINITLIIISSSMEQGDVKHWCGAVFAVVVALVSPHCGFTA